jgi:hypothetical protein
LAAVQRINDQRVVEERVRADPSPFVREGAARMVASEDVLRSLARRDSQPSSQAVAASESWVITGRLVDQDGSPFAKQKILLLGVEQHTHLPQDCRDCADAPSAETGANGSFRFELRKDKLGPRQAFTLAVRSKDGLAVLSRNGTPFKLLTTTAPNPTHLGRLTARPQD